MLAFGDNYSFTQTMGRYLEPNPPPALILPVLDLQVGVVNSGKYCLVVSQSCCFLFHHFQDFPFLPDIIGT